VTVPLPLPLAPVVIVIHATSLVAVHVHPALVETVTVGPAPPSALIVSFGGLTEYEHVPA
jgi:hypothetical protein